MLRAHLACLVSALLLTLSGCGPTNGAPPPHDPSPPEEAAPVPVNDTPPRAPSSATVTLPADVHAVVFFSGPRGREHIDTHVVSDATTTTIVGVHADESRAHPVTQRAVFNADERAEYTRLFAALGAMPRCEPLARFPDEPIWRIEFDGQGDTGPSLWFRDNGEVMLASSDPCLAYVRLAHFFYATWAQRVGL